MEPVKQAHRSAKNRTIKSRHVSQRVCRLLLDEFNAVECAMVERQRWCKKADQVFQTHWGIDLSLEEDTTSNGFTPRPTPKFIERLIEVARLFVGEADMQRIAALQDLIDTYAVPCENVVFSIGMFEHRLFPVPDVDATTLSVHGRWQFLCWAYSMHTCS